MNVVEWLRTEHRILMPGDQMLVISNGELIITGGIMILMIVGILVWAS